MIGRIARVWDSAKVEGISNGSNPAAWKGNLELLLPKIDKATNHHEAMPYDDVPKYTALLAAKRSTVTCATLFTILTAARSNETRFLTWEDIDRSTNIWVVPAHKMKMTNPHYVPLSKPAVDILDYMAKINPPGSLQDRKVFSLKENKPLSDGTMRKLLQETTSSKGENPYTIHGFRSSFSDWANDQTNHSREVIEAALSHIVGNKSERAYRRGSPIEKHRALMNDWASYLFKE